MWQPSDYPITIAQMSTFQKAALGVFEPSELEQLINHLAYNPDDGVVIPHTGGIRKIRWGAKGHGKSGGARIIYYFRDLNMPLYLLAIYVKGEKIDLSMKEKRQMEQVVNKILEMHGRRWLSIIAEQQSG